MHSDTKSWMHGAAERSIKVLLMTAEDLTRENDALDAGDTEKLHWCWEGIKCIMSAKLTCAQLEAHEAANAPVTLEDLNRTLKRVQAKLGIMDGNGNGVVKPAA